MTRHRRPVVIRRAAAGVVRLAVTRGPTGAVADLARAQELVAACDEVALDDRVRVVTLLMGGRSHALALAGDATWLPPHWPDVVAAVARIPQPVVAGLAGPVRGLGLALAFACDLRIVTTASTMLVPGAAVAGFPGGGLTQRLPRMIGTGRAMELLTAGGRVSARDAVTWGLASEAVAPSRLEARVMARARALAARGPIALRYAKEAVRRALDLPLDDGARLEHDLYVLLQTTTDRREGVRAFLGRRGARFRGR